MEEKLLEVNVKLLENLLKENDITDICEFDKEFLVTYTYDAVSLEGKNRIPFESVKRLIEVGAIAGFSEREIKEVQNHVNAYNEVIKLTKIQNQLNEDNIKDLHAIIQNDIMIGGVYRNVNIQIPGAEHQPPNHIKVYMRMKQMFEDIKNMNLSLFDEGIYLHAQLNKIHPFLDGNGRVSRLVLNYYLIKAGFIPVSIPLDYREEYFKVLETFKVEKNIEPLKLFIIKLLNERYEKLIDKLEV